MQPNLQDPVTVLSGVGPKRVTALKELGIETIADLLYYFPFRYEDLKVKELADVADQEKVTLKGVVVADPVISRFGPHRNRLNVRLLINHAVIRVTFFNQPYLKDKFTTGTEIAVYGKWDAKRKSLTGMKVLAVQNEDHPSYEPIYSVSKKIRQGTLVKLIQEAYKRYQGLLVDLVPSNVRSHYRLMNEQEMVQGMHFPKSLEEAQAARRTAIFREFFLFQLRLQTLKNSNDRPENGVALEYDNDALKKFIKTFPFELTNAQKRVVNEICRDMRRPQHMNRLLQGDVGSGKTIVAAIALFATVTAGYQAALMAPTEILAEQHYNKLAKLFAPLHVSVSLLTGSLRTQDKRQALADLRSGRTNIVIGTHALIQEDVDFKRLGLAIIDEQHRFGVNQRRILREKGQKPDILTMTATPIPRTLAITAYGEMDVSTIDEMPAGRLPIQTTWIRSNQVQNALQFVRQQLEAGQQVFVITPLIAESETLDLKTAEQIYDQMNAVFGNDFKVALLHGQMKDDEKNAIMADFAADRVQLLVATTVVEVGVDVPNANVMLIFDADRFGLAQLHQLRGRVGRGKEQAYCILIADPKNQTAIERMTIMTETTSGFTLAQKDLELRGAGDVFGDRQSGLPAFKIGDPVADINSLQVAQLEVQKLFEADPDLREQEHWPLAHYLDVQKLRQPSFD
ncbi:ATP-dependent DNA helicase RecG [Lactobacillus selangorensis]|uniref:ATP-dependent DNA helicase RecG n=1 Tax=Lactobacillus selangorensis TaxID=81857 RepID=A0A0R2FM01_9LACO|nr:ATP-dependent DNA helicase RecG [Lactobacillus selangorensis]KRN29641.1 ATP-dependent DNA helicase RecG [Lactobacillus selangorensis]KRN33830.1 ATP-dependent DNA helicase RecG [Lactobacillus selangorensis]